MVCMYLKVRRQLRDLVLSFTMWIPGSDSACQAGTVTMGHSSIYKAILILIIPIFRKILYPK